MKENEPAKIGGFPANAIVIPLAVVIAILHFAVFALAFETNRSNSELSDLMQSCSDCQQYATNLQASCSTLSETASSFALRPATEDGELNTGPLIRYAQELERDRGGSQVADWFRERHASTEVQSYIDAAVETSEQMYETQLHVIALLCSIYPCPPAQELSAIPTVSLSEQELAMPEESREAYARGLILGKDYSMLKASVAENVESCHRTVQQEYTRASALCQRHIAFVRLWLLAVLALIIVIMLISFALLYAWLILPLRKYEKQIASDQSMDLIGEVREMRLVAYSYNELLRRHNRLESILRSAAETDALTKLPNRYSLQQDILDADAAAGSMAVVMFDVDYLKQANDEKGHDAGDKLLCSVASCICECFGTEDGGRCYRIGGDEFAAVLRGIGEEEVKNKLKHFSSVLERENLSVSTGYAFSEMFDENSFEMMLGEADLCMYAQKKRTHKTDRSEME